MQLGVRGVGLLLDSFHAFCKLSCTDRPVVGWSGSSTIRRRPRSGRHAVAATVGDTPPRPRLLRLVSPALLASAPPCPAPGHLSPPPATGPEWWAHPQPPSTVGSPVCQQFGRETISCSSRVGKHGQTTFPARKGCFHSQHSSFL